MPHIRLAARTLFLGVFLLAFALGTPARATTLDYQGYAFETGGFPASAPGDILRFPVVVTGSSLAVDLTSTELTGWIDGLVSTGTQDAGDGVQLVTFSNGSIEFWRDPSLDHAFGSFPPNATVPASFQNGTPCLVGTISDFVLYLDVETNTGAYEGIVNFTDGVCLDELGAGSAEGYTFGGVLTRAVSGGVPEGYDFAIDGYLEAQKKPATECPMACFAIASARLDFPRHAPRRFGPKDGKFNIEASFLPCVEFGDLDPSAVEVRVRIGSYVQVLPEGAFERDGNNEWKFSNERGTETLTKIQIERERNGEWEIEVKGRGIPRTTLIGAGNRLEVELTLGTMSGTDEAALVQKKHYLRFRDRHHPCRRGGEDDDDAPGLLVQTAGASLLAATPNPFNATTTIRLRTVQDGMVAVSIFDVRGRRVRALQAGALAAGEHRFVWDGRDAQGNAVPSGVFLYRVDAPGIAETRKLVMAK